MLRITVKFSFFYLSILSKFSNKMYYVINFIIKYNIYTLF